MLGSFYLHLSVVFTMPIARFVSTEKRLPYFKQWMESGRRQKEFPRQGRLTRGVSSMPAHKGNSVECAQPC